MNGAEYIAEFLNKIGSKKIFVVTGGAVYNSNCTFLSDGVPLIAADLMRGYSNYAGMSPIGNGNAHRVLAPGSTLDVYVGSSYCPFYVEGYYAHP